MAPYLHGNIPAVRIIDEVLERDDHVIPILPVQAVVTVIDSNEPHPQHGENLLNVPPGLNIVPAEPGQVLYDHAVNRTFPDIA